MKSFKIKGQLWKVIYKKVVKDDEGNLCFGLTDKDQRKIYVEKNLKGDQLKLVLFHEYCHALFFELHLSLDHNLEEVIVDGFSSTIYRQFSMVYRKRIKSDPYQK